MTASIVAGPDHQGVAGNRRVPGVLVQRKPVMMLWMIVIGVDVNVQRGRWALRGQQGNSEHDRDAAVHEPESM